MEVKCVVDYRGSVGRCYATRREAGVGGYNSRNCQRGSRMTTDAEVDMRPLNLLTLLMRREFCASTWHEIVKCERIFVVGEAGRSRNQDRAMRERAGSRSTVSLCLTALGGQNHTGHLLGTFFRSLESSSTTSSTLKVDLLLLSYHVGPAISTSRRRHI